MNTGTGSSGTPAGTTISNSGNGGQTGAGTAGTTQPQPPSTGGGVVTSATGVAPSSGGHGEVTSGYGGHIVPVEPLHLPDLVRHLNPGSSGCGENAEASRRPRADASGEEVRANRDASGCTGASGTALPSRINPIAPTDINPGQYAAPVSGFRHASGGSGGRTGGQGDLHIHVQRHVGTPAFNTHVPPKPGKNMVPGYRSTLVATDGTVSTCVMSGMGRRVVINQDGQSASYGHAETMHFRSRSAAHLPSNHQLASRCLISVEHKD
jgi:hypothetical protein